MDRLLNRLSKRFLWRLYFWYVLVIVISVLAISVVAERIMSGEFLMQAARDLTDMARTVNDAIAPIMERSHGVQAGARALAAKANVRITIIDANGLVLADSEQDPASMDNHRTRPEVAEALAGQSGHAVRHSDTLHKDMLYAAFPVSDDHGVRYIVRVSRPLTGILEVISPNMHRLLVIGGLVILLGAALSYLAYRKQVRPLIELKAAAGKFARGEFGMPLRTDESEDMRELFDAMNQMAVQLDSRIKTITQQSREREAILESLAEGVIAVSSAGVVTNVNTAAVSLLDGPYKQFEGRLVVEVIRSAELQRFIQDSLNGIENREKEFSLHGKHERLIRATSRPLVDDNGVHTGTVVVMHDLTKIKSLENMRRDFVANVSHELRTPITSIKGSVDTLEEGALEDPAAARKFLNIISRHSDRLMKIVDDLLGLARIEAGKAAGSIVFTPLEVSAVVHSAVSLCEQRALEKNVSLKATGFDVNPKTFGNDILIEQALVNLITNAIDYSEVGSEVSVSIKADGHEVIIKVRDAGCGIPEPHLDRIFERFYRVDRARSRKPGGTGLGLSIVKHVAQLHSGTVTVESTLGKGSTFSLTLPSVS